MRFWLQNRRRRRCPRCHEPLEALSLHGLDIDACSRCHGAWFDATEVESFLDRELALEESVPEPQRTWRKSELDCPVCRMRMQTLVANSVFPFELDKCPHDNGYWFDNEELDGVVASVKKPRLRILRRSRSAELRREQEVVRMIESRTGHLRYTACRDPEGKAPVLADISFFEHLSGAQKIVALLGLPVESGRFCEWGSWMNLLLLAANVAVFVVMLLLGGSWFGLLGGFPREWYMTFGFVPEFFHTAPLACSYTLLTSQFIHAGIVHLLGNMFFLFVTGDDVERRMGHWGYLWFYLAGGVAASLVSFMTRGGWSVAHVGASGGISAVLGAYLVLCRHKSFYVWILRIGVFGKMISVSAWLYLLFWLAWQFVSSRVGSAHVDYWAHIGGFGFGVCLGLIARRTRIYDAWTGQWVTRREAGREAQSLGR